MTIYYSKHENIHKNARRIITDIEQCLSYVFTYLFYPKMGHDKRYKQKRTIETRFLFPSHNNKTNSGWLKKNKTLVYILHVKLWP